MRDESFSFYEVPWPSYCLSFDSLPDVTLFYEHNLTVNNQLKLIKAEITFREEIIFKHIFFNVPCQTNDRMIMDVTLQLIGIAFIVTDKMLKIINPQYINISKQLRRLCELTL